MEQIHIPGTGETSYQQFLGASMLLFSTIRFDGG